MRAVKSAVAGGRTELAEAAFDLARLQKKAASRLTIESIAAEVSRRACGGAGHPEAWPNRSADSLKAGWLAAFVAPSCHLS
jgi:hypothetical protein